MYPTSVQFSHSVMSDFLWLHGLQHSRLPCPSPNPRNCQNSCPSGLWCHWTISSSVIPFSFCLQSFPASESFQMSLLLCIRWPKYWSFSFSINPFSEYSGLISFRMDWLDLLAVKGTLKSLLQHHSSKASILWCSAFFIVQLLHPYMTTGKTIGYPEWIINSLVKVSAELKFELQLFASRACTINYWTVSKHKMNWKVYSFLMDVL